MKENLAQIRYLIDIFDEKSRRRIPLFNIFSRKKIDFGHEAETEGGRALGRICSSFFSLNDTERSISREHGKVFLGMLEGGK